jgi:hypothetical protein
LAEEVLPFGVVTFDGSSFPMSAQSRAATGMMARGHEVILQSLPKTEVAGSLADSDNGSSAACRALNAVQVIGTLQGTNESMRPMHGLKRDTLENALGILGSRRQLQAKPAGTEMGWQLSNL